MATVYRMTRERNNGWLNPPPVPGFNSLRSARSFARGYVCVKRVVADRGGRVKTERFVVVHPDTAKRHGWKVAS